MRGEKKSIGTICISDIYVESDRYCDRTIRVSFCTIIYLLIELFYTQILMSGFLLTVKLPYLLCQKNE